MPPERTLPSRGCWIMLLLTVLSTPLAGAQGTNQPVVPYTLLEGSQLIVECPICAVAPITLPLRGTANLQAVEYTPAFARYAMTDILFAAAGTAGLDYVLTGTGNYWAPGLPSFGQQLFLDLSVGHETNQSECFFTNTLRTVSAKMPVIQVNLDQTNATPTIFYRLKLVAAPAIEFTAVVPEPQTGSLRLNWVSTGLPVQVEKASSVTGPFAPIGSVTTQESWVDPGALTNSSPQFFRLRWSGP